MGHHSFLTVWLNQLLGPTVAGLMNSLGITPADEMMPIPDFAVMGALVVLILVTFVLWLRPRLSVERPGATQQVVEMLFTNPMRFGIRDLLDDNAGHHGRKFMPVVATVSLFILLSNLLSLVPVLTSPTGHISVPFACALITFFYFNLQGVKEHGVGGYLKHFAGSTPWLAPLFFPVEIISTTARVLSLTVRLWANMFSSELLYFVFLGLLMGPVNFLSQKSEILGWVVGIFPATIPVAFVALHIFVAVIQSFVFTILPSIYLGMATAHEH